MQDLSMSPLGNLLLVVLCCKWDGDSQTWYYEFLEITYFLMVEDVLDLLKINWEAGDRIWAYQSLTRWIQKNLNGLCHYFLEIVFLFIILVKLLSQTSHGNSNCGNSLRVCVCLAVSYTITHKLGKLMQAKELASNY